MKKVEIIHSDIIKGIELVKVCLPETTGMKPADWLKRYQHKGISINSNTQTLIENYLVPTTGVAYEFVVEVYADNTARNREDTYMKVLYRAADNGLVEATLEAVLELRDYCNHATIRDINPHGAVNILLPTLADVHYLMNLSKRSGADALFTFPYKNVDSVICNPAFGFAPSPKDLE